MFEQNEQMAQQWLANKLAVGKHQSSEILRDYTTEASKKTVKDWRVKVPCHERLDNMRFPEIEETSQH